MIEIHQSGKGYKAISEVLGLQNTVRAIISKWRKFGTVLNLPRIAQPTKISPRIHYRLIQEIPQEPRQTSNNLQALLVSDKVRGHDSTIRVRLDEMVSMG